MSNNPGSAVRDTLAPVVRRCDSCQECGCDPDVCHCECHKIEDKDEQMNLWMEGCEVR